MYPLVAVFLCVLAFVEAPAALAGTCTDPADTLDCSQDCASLKACLACCLSGIDSVVTCKAECVRSYKAARAQLTARPEPDPQLVSRPTRPAPTPRMAHRPLPIQRRPTEPPIDLTRFSASCRMEQAGDQVIVSLQVQNDTGADVTGAVPRRPLVQTEAGTKFVLNKGPSPRSYSVIRAGDAAAFRWQGRLLRSSGALGISASASAVASNGQRIETPQVDCGTIDPSQPTQPGEEPTGPSREATLCAACHSSPHMAFVASKWLESAHASSANTVQGKAECATCHSPLQAGPGASRKKGTIPEDDRQGVTCSVCHPPKAQRAQWDTPIATYDATTGTYSPVALWDADFLCTHCHTGKHERRFHSYGEVMRNAGVRCIDCHMAKIPADDPNVGQRAAHDFKVAANLPYSCGTYPGGCHARRPESWAARLITAGTIHAP